MAKQHNCNPIYKHLRQKLRATPTDTERFLWQHLRARSLEDCRFLRQYSIGNYIVDFYCPSHRIVVELDGSQHMDQKKYDDDRTKYIESQGNVMLRFWDNDVLNNINGVLEIIRRGILERTPPNLPLSQGEEIKEGSLGEKIIC